MALEGAIGAREEPLQGQGGVQSGIPRK